MQVKSTFGGILSRLIQHLRLPDIHLPLYLNRNPVRGNAYLCIRVVEMSLAEQAEATRCEMQRMLLDGTLQFSLRKLVQKLVIVKDAVDHVFEVRYVSLFV